MARGGLVQRQQRRGLAVDGEDRVGDDQRAGLDALGERGSTAATSRCGTTTTRARDSRQASTIEAWFCASETTSVPGPARAATTPRLAR